MFAYMVYKNHESKQEMKNPFIIHTMTELRTATNMLFQ